MARDYAKKGGKKRGSASTGKKSAPGWLWLLTGLTVGLFIAFLVYLGQHDPAETNGDDKVAETDAKSGDTPKHIADKKKTSREKTVTAKSTHPARPAAKQHEAASVVVPAKKTEKPSAPVAPKKDEPKVATAGNAEKEPAKKPMNYDFYKILPQSEVVVPEGKAEKAKPVDDPGNYILQVGSFRSIKEADARKAELALLGIVANVQAVSTDGKAGWHRVRIGPYRDPERLNKVQQTLRENHIEFVTMKERS